MTINQLINRLSKNASNFLLGGEREKSNACMELLALIKTKGFDDIRGKLEFSVDNT